MEPILKQVSRVRRRLWAEQFLQRLGRCWFVALLLAAIAIAAPKVIAMEGLSPQWAAWWLGGAVASGAFGALAWMALRPQTALEAAIEIDRRFDLRERVASSMSLGADEAKTPAGQALVRDAQRVVERLDVGERFHIALGRRAWLPLAPALAAALLATLVDNKQAQSQVEPQPNQLTRQELDNAAKALRERLVQRKKEAAQKGLTEAENLFRELEKNTEKLAATKDLDRKQTLVKLNDLAKQLAERREQLGGDEDLRKQLAGMKDFNKGPAEKMAEAMKQGNWNTARKELEKLQQQLAAGKMDEALKQQLQQQLSQLKEKLQQAADAKQQAIDDLKKQIAQKKNQGDRAEAGRLQQKLDQMQKQQRQAQQLEKLAQQMSQAQQAMQQGDQQAAADALQQMMQQMEQMQQEISESDLLQAAIEQIEMAKDAMACDKCQGQGCSDCQGEGQGMSDLFSENLGRGMGAGRGAGPRPDEKNDVGFRNSRVKQNPGRGAAVMVGEAEGPNFRGQVLESIKEEMQAHGSEPADPLVIEQLPKSRRQHTEEYFNSLREGK